MSSFSTTLPILVFTRAAGEDWIEFDRGPGVFHIPEGSEAGVRIHNIDDNILGTLVGELEPCPIITSLNLSENRKITNAGLEELQRLPNLTELNLSSCDLTDNGLVYLAKLKKLKRLNLSFCNRISIAGLKNLARLDRLVFLDIQGCLKIKPADLTRFKHKGLEVHK
jgi:hypothetical protein